MPQRSTRRSNLAVVVPLLGVETTPVAERAQRWRACTPDGLPLELARDGDDWVVVAAATVQGKRASLRAAIEATVGHLVDEEWVEALCQAVPRAAARAHGPAAAGGSRAGSKVEQRARGSGSRGSEPG